jgi:hypothetical protein
VWRIVARIGLLLLISVTVTVDILVMVMLASPRIGLFIVLSLACTTAIVWGWRASYVCR